MTDFAAISGQRSESRSIGLTNDAGKMLKADFVDGAKAFQQSGAATAGARGAATVAGETLASGALRIGGTILTANAILQGLHSAAERSQVHAAIERFHLDPTNARDVLAARAYVWGRNMAPNQYWSVPYSGPVNERVATSLMRLERLAPTTLGRATSGDRAAQAKIDTVVRAAVEGPINSAQMRRIAGVDAQTDTRTRPIPAAAVSLDTNRDGRLQCREIGRWMPEPGYAARERTQPNANRYQDFIGRHPGQHFVIPDPRRASGTTTFDACTDTPAGAHLSEAKADHNGVLQASWAGGAREQIGEQGAAQARVATTLGVTNDVRAQNQNDTTTIRNIYRDLGLTTPVIHNPIRP